jgi:hypothetical protein
MLFRTIILMLLLFLNLNLYSQEISVPEPVSLKEDGSVVIIEKQDKVTLLKQPGEKTTDPKYEIFREYININKNQGKEPQKVSFNLVASFRSNIRFGGYWQGYAIVNFTPNMYIKPFGFLSLYASHNYSKFIPVKSLKENFSGLAAEGAAILAIDNSVKFLFPDSPVLRAIAGFAGKIIIIDLLFKNNKKKRNYQEFRYYYYAFTVSF